MCLRQRCHKSPKVCKSAHPNVHPCLPVFSHSMCFTQTPLSAYSKRTRMDAGSGSDFSSPPEPIHEPTIQQIPKEWVCHPSARSARGQADTDRPQETIIAHRHLRIECCLSLYQVGELRHSPYQPQWRFAASQFPRGSMVEFS